MTDKDLVIVGGGPAGLSAGIYAARSALSVLLIERELPGGKAATANLIDNYPGFPEGVGGVELAGRMEQQARRFGLEIETAELKNLEPTATGFIVNTSAGAINTGAVIIATGVEPRRLNIKGETEYTGRGVSYCATCDGPFFQDKNLAVVGGGDEALEEALHLTKFAAKIYLIHRRKTLKAAKALQDEALSHNKIEYIPNAMARGIEGGPMVNGLRIKEANQDGETLLPVEGVFIYADNAPLSAAINELVETDERGFIVTDDKMRTSYPGIFAAGDVRHNTLRQVVTAVSDGAVAAVEAERYLKLRSEK